MAEFPYFLGGGLGWAGLPRREGRENAPGAHQELVGRGTIASDYFLMMFHRLHALKSSRASEAALLLVMGVNLTTSSPTLPRQQALQMRGKLARAAWEQESETPRSTQHSPTCLAREPQRTPSWSRGALLCLPPPNHPSPYHLPPWEAGSPRKTLPRRTLPRGPERLLALQLAAKAFWGLGQDHRLPGSFLLLGLLIPRGSWELNN